MDLKKGKLEIRELTALTDIMFIYFFDWLL